MNEHVKTSKLALASLLLSCGTLLLGPFGFIPGIVCGHVARFDVRNNPLLRGEGLAIAGITIGYIFLALTIALLAFWLVAMWA